MESNTAPPPENHHRKNMQLGDYQFRIANFPAALTAYRAAISCDPEDAEAYGGAARSLFQIYHRTHNQTLLAEARAMAEVFVKKAPGRAEAHRNYASILRESGLRNAMEHAQKAVELRPTEPENHISLGLVHWDQRQFKQAIECFDEALTLSPTNVNALVNCGSYWLYIKGNRAKAREYATSALRLYPGHPGAHVLMGRLLLQEGKIPEAMENARLVIGRDPNNYEALHLIAVIETRRNPFRGFGFRLAAAYARLQRKPYFYVLYIPFCIFLCLLAVAFRIPVVVAWLFPTIFVSYLRFATKSMARYVRKNYYEPTKLDKNF